MMPTRRELLRLGLLAGLADTVATAQSGVSASRQPAALGPGDGELVYVGSDPVRIKVSPQGERGRFGMIAQDVSPATSIPVHLHEREDEIIFIQSGTGEATLGDAQFPNARQCPCLGTLAQGPRSPASCRRRDGHANGFSSALGP